MNVKQGDMAIIVKAKIPENIGKIVKVLEFAGESHGRSNVWIIAFQRPSKFWQVETGKVGVSLQATAPDEWLRPISGLPDADDIDESISHDAGMAVPA